MKKRQANKIYRAILFGAWKGWRVKTLIGATNRLFREHRGQALKLATHIGVINLPYMRRKRAGAKARQRCRKRVNEYGNSLTK